ncbi:MAG: hypothetical protein N0C90_00585, partial [Candidatus Thiodiazotropha endolucinida]|nr:hypothetical protein [Candidatus Thiodiazotropha taylori]MCW4259842.1 hypothetical protein [Candidatus Thiodiazotropha endolucinida]
LIRSNKRCLRSNFLLQMIIITSSQMGLNSIEAEVEVMAEVLTEATIVVLAEAEVMVEVIRTTTLITVVSHKGVAAFVVEIAVVPTAEALTGVEIHEVASL